MLNICNNIFIYIINNIFIYLTIYIYIINDIYIYLTIYSWNPNGPCFGWKRPCFEGVYPKKMQVISVWALDRYIYIQSPIKRKDQTAVLVPLL